MVQTLESETAIPF